MGIHDVTPSPPSPHRESDEHVRVVTTRSPVVPDDDGAIHVSLDAVLPPKAQLKDEPDGETTGEGDA